jgi:peptidoglycan/LPS O-acetylase OafA/YrhL
MLRAPPELQRLSRQQLIVLAVFVIWALLLAVGLIGSSVAGLPRGLTATAGAIALIALFCFMPGGYLYALVLERRQRAVRAKGMSALAIRWRWYFLFSGALTVLAGLSLLISPAQVTPEIRLGGAVIFVWGLLALSVAVLAFRTKPRLSDPQRTR